MTRHHDQVVFELAYRLVKQLARDRSYYEDWGSTADWQSATVEVGDLGPEPSEDEPPLSVRAAGVFRSRRSGGGGDIDFQSRETEPFTVEVSLSAEPRDVAPVENLPGRPQLYHFSGRYDGPSLRLYYVGARPNWVQRDHVRIEVPAQAAELLAGAPHVAAAIRCEVPSGEPG
jgi:hypothetical protein